MIERLAKIHIDSFAGCTKSEVLVIAETPKRYRIKCIGPQKVRLTGRDRWLYPGDTALVPKDAVEFIDDEKNNEEDAEVWTEIPIQDLGPFVYGDALTHLVRLAVEKGDLDSAASIVPSLPAREFVDIILKRADIEGNDHAGFRVVYRIGIDAADADHYESAME